MAGQKKVSQTIPRYNQIQVQTATFGKPVALGWGTFRCSPNLIWYGNFVSTAVKQGGAGGKGGGGTLTGYNYSAAVIMGICEGPIAGTPEVFKDSSHYVDGGLHTYYAQVSTALAAAGATALAADYATLSTLAAAINNGTSTALQNAGLSLSLGEPAQFSPSWVASGQQLGYANTACAYVNNYALSSSATMPNHTFGVVSNTRASVGGVTLADAHPADIIADFLTHPSYGVPSWRAGLLGDLTEYWTACQAYGFFLSPVLDAQKSASDFLTEILKASNAEAFWSEGVLKIRPYADEALAANGAAFTPNLTPVYALSDSDFLLEGSSDPIEVDLKSPAEAYNYVQVAYNDRTHQYNSMTVPASDQASIDQYGLKKQPPVTLACVCMPSVATTLAQVMLQRTCNIRQTFSFKLPLSYCLLEPMDLVEVTDLSLGLDAKLCRITEIKESDTGDLDITAEEMLVGASSAPLITRQGAAAIHPNYDVAPGDVANPVLINPPRAITTGGGYEAWIAVAGGANWGGCQVWISLDGVNYQQAGTIDGPARYGVLTAGLAAGSDPDLTGVLSVDLSVSGGTLDSTSQVSADGAATLCLIDNELIAYQTATLTGPNAYNLTYLRRGLYGTAIAAHAAGAEFVRLDEGVFKYPYTAQQIGSDISVKFLSFNGYGRSPQALSDVAHYSLTLTPNGPGETVLWAQLDNVPALVTTLGGQSAVETSNVASNAITIPASTQASSLIGGDSGVDQTVLTLTLTLPQPGTIFGFANLKQNFAGGGENWSGRLVINGTNVFSAAGGANLDVLSMSGSLYCPAGDIVIAVIWNADTAINLTDRTLTVLVALR